MFTKEFLFKDKGSMKNEDCRQIAHNESMSDVDCTVRKVLADFVVSY